MAGPLAAIAVLCCASSARADGVCDMLLDPVEIGLRDSGFDQTRTACARTALSSGARATALIATDDFYGTLASSVFAGLRYELSRFELEAGARVIDYRFAQNAVLTDTEASVGPVFVGAALPWSTSIDGLPVRLAASLRLDVPWTDSGYGVAVGRLAAGVFASVQPLPKWGLHSRVSFLWEAAFPDRGADQNAAVAVSVDGARRLADWFAIGAGGEFGVGWHGEGLDHMLAKTVFRFFPGKSRLDLSLAAPIAGSERTNLAVQLGYARAL